MPLPRLRCPHEALHADFRGQIHAYTRYDVDLDADRNILRRSNPVDIADVSAPSDDAIYCPICDVEIWSKPRAITFSPVEGTILVCDFSIGFRPPEMIERRPCVVVSKERANRSLCVVVPISSTESTNPRAIVVPIPIAKYRFPQG
jgi:hypothetical protein